MNFKQWVKQVTRSSAFQTMLAALLATIARLVYHTTRWNVVGHHHPDAYIRNSKPFILCVWHDRLMMAPTVWRWRKPLHVLASAHADGRLIARVVSHFNMPAVYGSTGRGGTEALRKLIKLLGEGACVAVIPDGPRGPRHVLSPGVLTLSKLTKCDILTLSIGIQRHKRLGSWDRFIVARPFNKGTIIWGPAIAYERLATLTTQEAQALVQAEMDALNQQAESDAEMAPLGERS